MTDVQSLIDNFEPEGIPVVHIESITGDGQKWRNVATGEIYDVPPVGGIWFAPWLDDYMSRHLAGPQLEHCVVVRTPGGDWMIDARANNCDMRDDYEHHCWILHGPITSATVDKNGKTCGAGSGSILQGSYHGFLRKGKLVNA